MAASTAYPTASEITAMFRPLSIPGAQAGFFDHVSPTVSWTILGHSPMSTTYTGVAEFRRKTLGVLGEHVLSAPLCMEVAHPVRGGGDSSWAVVELKAAAGTTCRNGLRYDMTYCWVIQFNDERQIAVVRAYLDTDLLTRAINENAR